MPAINLNGVWQVTWLVIALHLIVPTVLEANYASRIMRRKLTKAVPSHEVIVVVHQIPKLIGATISFLDQRRYATSPRAILIDRASYPIAPSLARRATMIQYSKQGELSLNVDVRTVTLIGGAAQDCLKRSGQLLIREVLDRRGRQKLTIRIPTDVVWGWKHDAGGFTLNDSFCRGDLRDFDSKVKEFAETFMEGGSSNLFSMTQLYQRMAGRNGGMDYGFVFTRTDGKQITLVIEQLCGAS